jgi:hypothetical protein
MMAVLGGLDTRPMPRCNAINGRCAGNFGVDPTELKALDHSGVAIHRAGQF